MRARRYGWAVSDIKNRRPLTWGGWFRIYTSKKNAMDAAKSFKDVVVTRIDLKEAPE